MNLLQTIRTQWAANSTLNGLIPAATKLQTGVYQYAGASPSYPFCTIQEVDRYPEDQSNTAATERVTVRITSYHNRSGYDALVTIADAIDAVFNRAGFNLSGSDYVLTMERAGRQSLQDEDDDWYIVQDYTCLVHLATGV